jgi:hypothetical protein
MKSTPHYQSCSTLTQYSHSCDNVFCGVISAVYCNCCVVVVQAILKSTESVGFCSGVILKENLVLTTAQCAQKYVNFQVAVGECSSWGIMSSLQAQAPLVVEVVCVCVCVCVRVCVHSFLRVCARVCF